MKIKEPVKELTKAQSIELTLIFASREEKECYTQFLTREGRQTAAYILYLLEQEMRGKEEAIVKRDISAHRLSGNCMRVLSDIHGMEVRYKTDK